MSESPMERRLIFTEKRVITLEQQLADANKVRIIAIDRMVATVKLLEQQLAAKDAEIAMLRTGDTCARQCEGTAYRIEARNLKRQLAESKKQNVLLREFVKMLRDYIPASAVGNVTVQEALAATQDLSGCILCDAEPVAVADGSFNHNCELGTPLYKARTK